MRELIINADDYGLTRGVSQEIRFAFGSGLISSTTAMLTVPGALRGLEIAVRDTPALPIGIHLTLTVGTPLSAPEEVPSLVDGEGRFFQRDEFLARLDQISPEEAGREFRAQIGALIALGIQPDHLDSHHFVSYLTPALLEQMLRLAEEFHLAVRPPAGCDAAMQDLFPGLPPAALAFLRGEAQAAVRRAGVPTADRLYLTFYDKTATKKNLQWILSDMPEGVSEIMCHPGLADDDLRRVSDYAEERGNEVVVLTESGLPQMLQAQSIQLTAYSRLHA
jgi:predicted glycoside hydrolase/deacetylase ChbG (UPF0249 family)